MIESLKNALEADPTNPFLQGHVEALDAATEKLMARRSAAACSPRELATKIATRLFTNGFGDEGTRLDIRKSVEMVEHSIGGWCFRSVVDQIEKAILEENSELSQP